MAKRSTDKQWEFFSLDYPEQNWRAQQQEWLKEILTKDQRRIHKQLPSLERNLKMESVLIWI